ncbi:MAG: membrane-bound lytic murein transglycosylase MltF [Stagnimonas sp.]|nr:membrane-bound lytic murein transglycosylase MltF [Stagnimonas sp.]
MTVATILPLGRFVHGRFPLMAATAWGLAVSCMLGACSPKKPPQTRLEVVQQAGVLKVASVYGRTTCYTGPSGLVGYECELAQGIAASVGATAEVLFVPTPADAVQAVIEGRAHLAAAALSANIVQRDQLRFSRAVDRSAPRLVFRMGNVRPKTPADLTGRLLVSEGAGHASRMAMLSSVAPGLKAETTNAYDAEDLLFQVASGELDYTIASSSLIAINERYYPQIRTAFDVGEPEDVVLAFKGGEDRTLFDAAEAYLARINGKELARLHDRYYGHVEELDYFSAVQVANHMLSRLPRYRPMFNASGERHDIDWRLLAAIGYQESHWNPSALSYTGVRGIMMLTNDTALRYKVSNREDPAQSIEGGARVLADLLEKIPPEVLEPDRTWMALAAYNQGLGHLLDARQLTAERGGDNLHWVDVRDTYPLLSRPRWAKKAKYGFARGREAVDFVSNVRAYLDIITMLSSGVRTLPPPPLRLDPELRMAQRDKELPLPDAIEPDKLPRLETDERLRSVEDARPAPTGAGERRLQLDETLPLPPPKVEIYPPDYGSNGTAQSSQ